MAATASRSEVMPPAASRLDRLDEAKPAEPRLRRFHSAGGMASPAALRAVPFALAAPGPRGRGGCIARRRGVDAGAGGAGFVRAALRTKLPPAG